MAVRFKILGSSSAGNCAFLQTENCRVLIDAGFSGRRIGEMLEACGESVENLDAVFITHEHSDHIAGLRGLARYGKLKVFANSFTAEASQSGLKSRLDWNIFETGSRFVFRDLEIAAFGVPHDAHDPVGFIFSHGQGDLFAPRISIGWALDLGYIPDMVRQRLLQVDVLVTEANHDSEMLSRDTRRPWSVKQRISGRHGHLSNEAARDLVENTAQARWREVFLAHLSRDCNTVECVKKTFSRSLAGAFPHRLSVVSPENGHGAPLLDLR